MDKKYFIDDLESKLSLIKSGEVVDIPKSQFAESKEQKLEIIYRLIKDYNLKDEYNLELVGPDKVTGAYAIFNMDKIK